MYPFLNAKTKMLMIETILQKTKEASYSLSLLDDNTINSILRGVATIIVDEMESILTANRVDLEAMERDNPVYDRLLLTEERIKGISSDILMVASLPQPVGRVIDERVRPNGMKIKRVRVPFGVIGVIYEARPNVSLDVSALCLKSHNATILKGGSDAYNSNLAIVSLIHKVLTRHNIDPNIVNLLPAGRETAYSLMRAVNMVDLLIPRGSARLINSVRENSIVPVIETGAGVCHTYYDSDADIRKGAAIVLNAKTRRVSVCNALDSLLIHESRLADLPTICRDLATKGVVIEADERAYIHLCNNYPNNLLQKATDKSFGTEFLSYRMSIKSVQSIEEAIMHIRRFSSKHSECIVTENSDNAQLFCQAVDAACIYVNVSTAFTDGAQFGLGAEIGISTQKLHARGPMGLEELTTYKWIVEGEGQIRN